ncbi:hypothetical protein K2224_22890 [Streptomyces sp. BHT-5-2]|uniref:MarR family transcriptional regulator n=1 Tax=Streptomyces sp. BHT-5-2 TaxID=2866715 RepID=UPI001C8D0218|nr:hypothetical protein K2224_22890 [Streptomyces sp. BHT-5-2]
MSDTNLDATTTRSDTPPEPLTGLTGATATVYTQLMGMTEPATFAELAHAAGIGHSTAGRAVSTLEKRGLAARTPGGHDDPRRMPDLWHPTIPASAPETKDGAEPDATSAQNQPESSPDKPTEPTVSAAEDAGTSIGENLSDTVTTPETDSTPCAIEPEPNTSHSDTAVDAASPPRRHPNLRAQLPPLGRKPALVPPIHRKPPRTVAATATPATRPARMTGTAPTSPYRRTSAHCRRYRLCRHRSPVGGSRQERCGRWSSTTSRHTPTRRSPPPASVGLSRSPQASPTPSSNSPPPESPSKSPTAPHLPAHPAQPIGPHTVTTHHNQTGRLHDAGSARPVIAPATTAQPRAAGAQRPRWISSVASAPHDPFPKQTEFPAIPERTAGLSGYRPVQENSRSGKHGSSEGSR